MKRHECGVYLLRSFLLIFLYYILFYSVIDYVCFFTFLYLHLSGKLRAKRTRYLRGKHNFKGTKWNINRKNTASQWEASKGDLLCNLPGCFYNLFGTVTLDVVFESDILQHDLLTYRLAQC